MEIERKYLIDEKNLPADLESCRSVLIEQGYLCRKPVVRIRRQDDDYILTYKSGGLMAREEYNLPLTAEAHEHLLPKADGNLISKKRYLIPLSDGLTAELDVFDAPFDPLCLAEVEFPDETAARRFTPPDWFGQEVTFSTAYHNSTLSRLPRESLVDKSFLLSNSTTL